MNEDMQVVLDKLDSVIEAVNVDRVFGKPQHYGDRTVIPVATLMYGVALGAGGAEVEVAEGDEGAAAAPGAAPETAGTPPVGSGAGGAAGAIARPIAYIEIDAEGVHVEPIVNEQVIALAGICLAGWIVAWLGAALVTLFSPRPS